MPSDISKILKKGLEELIIIEPRRRKKYIAVIDGMYITNKRTRKHLFGSRSALMSTVYERMYDVFNRLLIADDIRNGSMNRLKEDIEDRYVDDSRKKLIEDFYKLCESKFKDVDTDELVERIRKTEMPYGFGHVCMEYDAKLIKPLIDELIDEGVIEIDWIY